MNWRIASGPAAPETDVAPALEDEVAEVIDTPWLVVLYDDDIHTFEDVILQVVKATGCSAQRAERHAWTVHTKGKDVVYQGDFFECFRVQGVLKEIGLVTEIEG